MKNLFVSVFGSDANPGTEEAPFFSIEAALEAARRTKGAVTVTVGAGEYRISQLRLDKRDDGLIIQADGDVVINGGISLSASDFTELNKEEQARLHGNAKLHTRKIDLKRLGLTRADWGEMCAIGGFNTASHYNSAVIEPMWCELYVNNERQTIARYPNEGFLHTAEPVCEGDGRESVGSVMKHSKVEWESVRNPRSDIFGIDCETACRAASWKTLQDVWMFGYPAYTWADTSSPVVRIDREKCEMETKYVSLYGIHAGAPYYFYNIFEELDEPGEWYLERESGLLYYYPKLPLAESVIQLSISSSPLVVADGISDLTIRGFKFVGTRDSALVLSGNRITVEQCEIANTALWGIIADGNDIIVRNCEIHHTGRGGVKITGGNRASLISSHNLVTNNHFHNNAEIYKTGSPSIQLGGVGCIVSHNCIHDLAHQAVLFAGNEHIIEYNEIYNVCKYADDAGAIYSGRDYSNCGNIIRYNYFHDIQSSAAAHIGVFAIYSDDNNGATTVISNIMHRCQCAVLFHGGHDLVFKNNLIIEATPNSTASIKFCRYGYWKSLVDDGEDGQHLKALAQIPWDSTLWRERYPHIVEYLIWDPETEQCCPHYADMSNNLIVNHCPINISGFDIFDPKLKSNYANNIETDHLSLGISIGNVLDMTYFDASKILPSFKKIPINKIGLL